MARKALKKPGLEDDAPAPLHEVREDDDHDDEASAPLHFNPDGLIGQVADDMLADMKAAASRKPWEKMNEETQQMMISNAKYRARALVLAVAEAIASRGLPSISAKIEGGSFKVGGTAIKLKCEIGFTVENAERLAGGSATDVQLVFANVATFDGAMTETAAPDQPPLIQEVDGDRVDVRTGEILEGDQ